MLAAILAWFLLSSSGSSPLFVSMQEVQASIKADVGDKARRSELLSVIDEAEKTTKEYGKTMGKLTEEFTGLVQSHATQTADIQPLLKKSREDTEAYQDQMVSYLFALKKNMSREEWAGVFPAKQGQPEKK
jgi:hypothetical protein